MNTTKSKEQQEIDDWLPITSSRNAKWWYSAFHNVTAMVGAGVLSLPYAMSELGWYVLNARAQFISSRYSYRVIVSASSIPCVHV
jgi:hypothetical protein